MRLKDKVAIITGGGSGIGKEGAVLYCKEGAKVVVADFSEENGQKTVAELKDAGFEVSFFKVNVVDGKQVKEMVDFTIEKYGRVDVLVNNAGITQDSMLLKMTDEQFDRVIDINLKGVFNCSREVAAKMIEQGSGRIINTSSVVGVYGNVGQTNYAATKAGVIGMTKSWAKELGPKGITVNAVAPGYIQTEMTKKIPEKLLEMIKEKTPLKRLGQPLDVAKVYLFLASSEADFLNGTVVNVDGGLVL
ncbi:3-oxoacyl-ACP reductase FabG [Dethiobacter alkaliphilus]|uniref:3-oxoacyl-[acyl-carrier-protein] reductase n=1 Tax=Dethiobacter alkaliphilus AHT 1 TaxID=555088 RepID=C0GD59_DETAL|nr:3-oxoacyl-ACP reductase FabG [Dethiobacter alkaliphilus]EEG79144.1 3-oxoacyl-(acyl-carrier-protein) reductase [Dethiobacter alkaliphilus AHT 1]